ncbi:MAG TPA: toll/interleukin-1 receptor domain-containing protein, partial [Thermoanaerobaculia bacterium]|nr:toll/interleukin-1 receptor domain-containing protein [Thermoanaerobaculia bacterium]
MSVNVYQRALRDFQDYADDVSRSRYRTFDDAIRRLASTLVSTTPLGDVVAQLPQVDFDQWYNAQRATVGSVVGSGTLTWPDDIRERLAMQVELVRRLAAGKPDVLDFTHDFMWTRNNFDDNIAEFVHQIFRPFVRDFLRLVHDSPLFSNGLRQREALKEPEVSMANELALFISHSARDAVVAKAIVTLFEKALKISARQIRCTSVEGYRLPAGVDTNEVLRTEVFGARLFIALLTPNSLNSPYVLFELGARWGARRPLYPVLAGGATPAHLSAPLSGLNALSASVADQVRQLVEDASEALSERM